MKITLTLAALLLAGGQTLSYAAAEPPKPADTEPVKPAAKIQNLFDDPVIAKGKGVEVKRSQVEDALAGLKSNLAARGQALSTEEVVRAQPQVLERLIQVQLLLAKATDADKSEARENTTKRIDAIKSRYGNEDNLDRQLKAAGTTQEELRTKMIEESTAQAVLERELNVVATDDEVKKFYDDNPAKFEQPEMVRASHILLSIRDPETNKELSDDQKAAKHKLAEDLLKRARAGEDFAKLAKQYSEDPGSKDKGGEYQFPRGQMVPEFESAAFSLKTNEVSNIITTQFGYHIIKLSEKIPAKKVELAKVAPDVKEYLKQQQMQKKEPEIKQYMSKLQKDADVKILDDQFKPKETSVASPSAAGAAETKPTGK
ncbi:MAG TPA: peptidylprolyl isomerase [Candidatus Limnocylindrales bacterium]|jgi:peptidyl-prolyl cis-trans isomerase C|nr:peptidylprolyl isomerase [Candidatus Limnocylindrales bacterium]